MGKSYLCTLFNVPMSKGALYTKHRYFGKQFSIRCMSNPIIFVHVSTFIHVCLKRPVKTQ
jgi:hypothetical protein